ncbi:hypothetical protein LT85_0405 [Collimonas arenae]|uniref:Uncharacterized protein n=1 Tax=Collimonas arenae TaxID=279058 RepID=A0A0A1F6Y0_9BURK|nr:hypothetical protein LT85_0405 [Collimonas arenae]
MDDFQNFLLVQKFTAGGANFSVSPLLEANMSEAKHYYIKMLGSQQIITGLVPLVPHVSRSKL